jgi:fibronectin type 3 domain-containing protein
VFGTAPIDNRAMRSPVGAVRLGLRGVEGSGSLKRLALASIIFVAALVATGPARADPTLVAAYSFDEGSGAAVTDASGNNHFGTISGATWTTTGKYGGALSFNGTNASVDLGALGTFYQAGFTLEAWVQKQSATKNDVTVLGTWTATQGGGPMIWVDHIATHYQLTMNQGMSNYLDSGQNPVAAVWQHLAVTFNGTTARFYIDGVEVANRAVSVGIGASNSWRIGAYGSTPGGFFDGLIDEVRIYSRALSATEVQTDMNTPVSSLLGPDTTPPSAPGTVTATAGTGQVSLSWGAATDNVGVTRYDVYRSTSSGFTPSPANRIAQPAGTSYVDTGVAPGTYYYKVTAEDAAANVGPASNEASATVLDTTPPSAPSGLAAGAAGTTVTLTWNAATDDVGVLRYNLHRGTIAGFTATAANRIAQPLGTSYTDTGLAAGTYYYKVTAEDAAGNVGASSNEASATIADTTPPTAPGALTATMAGATANLNWIASTDDVGVVRYNVHRGSTSGFTPTTANRIAQPTGTSYSDAGLAVGTYYYKVLAEDAAGNLSPASNEVAVTVADATAPTAPSGLTAAATGNSIGLSWTASTDDIGVIRYNVHRGTSAGFTPTAANRIAQPSGTSYTDAGVPPGTYYYKVTAEDAAGNVSAASNEVSTTIADTTAPTAPTALAATATGNSIGLSWTASTDDVGVTRYNVHRATTAGFTPTTANRIAQPTGASYTDTGLAAGTYYYKVTAQDAAANVSPASNEASATIAGADTVPPTVAVTAPTGGATVNGSVSVTADATDDRGVVGVQFKLDGQNLGTEDTATPYSVAWDTRAEVNGNHTLTAVARDAAGNAATSAAVNVTVSNAGVSTTGLRAAYGLDDGSGTTVLDSSDNHATAALVNGSWTTGKFGGAPSLNGTSSEVDPPALGTFYKTGFTYEAWVYKQTTKVDVGVVGSWVGSQNGGAMIWIDHLSGDYRLTLGGTLSNYLDSGRTPAVGQWQFVAATYDGSTARIYVDGVQAASKTFTGNVGDANTWRVGAYGSPAGGFFDGKIDNVRVYDRALSANEIQTDMASRVQPDQTPPTVSAFTPAAGATGINVGSSATVKFSEPMQASTVTSSTVQLLEGGSSAIAATVTYNASTNVATITPQAAMKYGTSYTVRVKGGTGPADLFGNRLAADATSPFATEASPPPVLVVGSTSNPFSMYLTEMLRNEGLDAFTTIDVSFLSPTLLAGFDVVLLGDIPLNAAQASTLTGWVNAGGNLIAMHPDKDLAGLLGLTTASGNLNNGYLKVDTSAPPGAGVVGSTIQFHGTADKYTLSGATAVATLYSNATTATPNPAVTLRSVGTSGGQAAAFTYDLAKSVVYTRQGNPAWAGQERDGVSGIRPDDMFYSTWIDTSRIAIPQADEQQRLLMNMITLMDRDKMPLPHFWYLPRGKKAVIVMSGDDHSPGNSTGGTASIFDRFKQQSAPGCVVANWECIRATSYVYPNSTLTNAQAASYVADGFEVALHPVVASCPTTVLTQAQLATYFDTQLAQWRANFTSIPSPVSSRTHCVYWPDWAGTAKIEAARGIRMDGNYYHYPGSWIGSKPGFLNGGGFPMRFADTDGTMIDVYQENTNMQDEGGQAYPATVDALLDNALGPNGYYGAFGTNVHTDNPAPNPNDEAIVASAQAHGVSIISYKQLLDWTDGRNASTIRGLSWSSGTFTFSTTVAAGANGLQVMLPTQGPTGTLSALACGGSPTTYSVQTIKGVQYATFDAITGICQATYS